MKGKKGITLISLMIYIIVLSLLIGVSSTFIKYFYKNTNEITSSSSSNQKYIRIVEYLTEDVNSEAVESIKVNNSNDLVFYLSNGSIAHEYYYNNKSLYYVSWRLENGEYKKDVQLNLCENIGENQEIFRQDNKILNKFYFSITIDGIQYNNIFIVE